MKKLTFLIFALLWVTVVPAWAAPTLTVHPERLVYECEVGRSYYRYFTVSGTDLTEDLSLMMFGDDLTFEANKTTITAEEAMAGVTVGVRYAPQAEGVYEGNLWIRSSEVAGVVQLLGTTVESPSIAVSETALNLTCPVNGMASATLDVTGNNLEESIWIIMDSPDQGLFDIDLQSIPYAQANGTTTLTVTYWPREAGCDTATITLWSHYANDAVIKLYGTATPVERNYSLVCMADVFDVKDAGGEDNYEITPAKPERCGHVSMCEDRGDEMVLGWRNGLMNIAVDRNSQRAMLRFNTSQSRSESETSFHQKTVTVTNYWIDSARYLEDRREGQSDIDGVIRADGTLAFDDFIVMSERIVTDVNTWTNKVISADTTFTMQLYRNMVLAKPNGTHCYSIPPEPDPGTAQPMVAIAPTVDPIVIDPDIIPLRQRTAQVYIEQREDTVMVWNLYNMGGCNRIVLDNGFFDWAWQPCGYSADGGCWYNYTPYRSTTPIGEVMLTVVTYLHRLRGVKGKVSEDAMTWGNTTFGDGNQHWSTDTYCDNVLTYNGDNVFDCEKTVWSISHVTRLIDGLLSDDPEVLTHPASDQNEDGEVNVSDVTCLIDRLLGNAR